MYKVELTRSAEEVYRWLLRRDRKLFDRIDEALNILSKTPSLGKPLKGALRGDRSYRVGAYRIIYTIIKNRCIILVLDIGHRRDIYRS